MMILPALVINILLLLTLIALVVQNRHRKNRTALTEPGKTTTPSPERAFQEAQNIIQDASQKADEIISQAERSGMKITSEGQLDGANFKKEYLEKMEQTVAQNQKQYLDELEKTLAAHRDFLRRLEEKSITTEQETENMMKARINELLFSLEQNLSSFLSSSEQRSIESISLELKSARGLIDTYRTQQLQLIDENIVAVLERTLSLVLKNKIDLKDQLDLVYEALEKAKVEKFFA